MLDTLDSIPWANLTHAYGSATDVPQILLDLADSSEEAVNELFGNIWHQGTVYEATAYAVPYLIEILDDPGNTVKMWICNLLASIANGTSYHDVHRPMFAKIGYNEVDQTVIDQELGWVRAAQEAVIAGFESYRRLANSQDRDTWLAALFLMVSLPVYREETTRGIAERLGATGGEDETTRAGLYLLLGRTGDQSQPTLDTLAAGLSGDSLVLRRAAAVALATIKPEPFPTAAREAVIECLFDDAVEETFVGLPWDSMEDVDRDSLMSVLDNDTRLDIAARVMADIVNGGGTHTSTGMMMDIVFPHDADLKDRPIESLTPLQRKVVKVIAESSQTRRIYLGSFREWGLPHDKGQLKAYADRLSDEDQSGS